MGLKRHKFDCQSVLERLVSLETEDRKIKEELEDTKKRSMRKTLIFKSIPQEQKRETWKQTKVILAKEIKKKNAKLRGHTGRRTINPEIICISSQNLLTGIFLRK